MRVTQGTFSYLPPLTDEQIIAQIAYAIANGWALSIEVTDDPHPRNIYWEMWGQPMFDLTDPAGVMVELRGCRAAFPNSYIKLNAYDARLGRQTTALSFITDRPAEEPRFVLDRQEDAGRSVRYSIRPCATPQASGQPYTG